MVPKYLRINAVTKQDRHEALLSVRDAMSKSGCAILDFQMFSNISICFRIEIAPEDVGHFFANLLTTKLVLSEQSVQSLSMFVDHPGGQKDISGTFEITFLHNDPDLKLDVPANG